MATISGLKLNLNPSKSFDSTRSAAAADDKFFGKRARVSMMRVKAMGGSSGAKFKGTQMREKQLAELIESKVMEAKEVCGGDGISDECKVAWDEVEEVSQAKADLRLKLEREEDPLENFCQDNPETDECRIYDD